MNNYDQEPATTPLDQSGPAPQTPAAQPVRADTKPPKKRRNAWSTVAFVFLILFILAGLAAGLFWYMWQNTQQELSSAGDVMIERVREFNAAERENAELTSRLEGLESATALSSGNDEEQIKKTAEQFNLALADPLESPVASLTKRDQTQAIATVATSEDSYFVYLKQVNGRWTVVWSGETAPSDSVRQQYGLTIK